MQRQNIGLYQQGLNNYSQSQFYNSLVHYSPVCPGSKNQNGSQSLSQHEDGQVEGKYEIFLVNKGWWKSLICILLMDALFFVIYLKFVFDTRTVYVSSNNLSPPIASYDKSSNYSIMMILCIVTLVLMNISYFFTQFLNPGVRNLSSISQQQLNSALKVQFCQKCNRYKTNKFVHCFDCEVCIWNYDHHCGFFSKCIGGKAQLYSFYSFLLFVALGFMTLLGCMCIEIGNI